MGLAALVLSIGLMAGCSSGSDSPANVNPLEGDAVPSGKTVPSDGAGSGGVSGSGSGTETGAKAGAGTELGTKAGDTGKDSGQSSNAPATK